MKKKKETNKQNIRIKFYFWDENQIDRNESRSDFVVSFKSAKTLEIYIQFRQ